MNLRVMLMLMSGYHIGRIRVEEQYIGTCFDIAVACIEDSDLELGRRMSSPIRPDVFCYYPGSRSCCFAFVRLSDR